MRWPAWWKAAPPAASKAPSSARTARVSTRLHVGAVQGRVHAAQCLAPFDHFMVAALSLQADEFEQEPHGPLGGTVARRLCFGQPTCQTGLLGEYPCRKPSEVGDGAIALETRVELLAQLVQ